MVNNYKTIGDNIDTKRISISGVDKDEESMNLVKYEEAFKLASKVISVMSEIYDVLIREMGV